ncbi:MAG: polyprenyl diphosphate synthase [Candidatus Jordarchaeum sp.]|uniref:polyprenyl diphosphate synthase n=1 Tax=Candidatus Jordarchaeum sp. TaxID=2823881 RepID=UPI00404A6323
MLRLIKYLPVSRLPLSLINKINNALSSVYEKILWHQIKDGRMPEHLAVILDGNRRFARQLGLKAWIGHKYGAEKVEDVLEWCWQAGVKIVTLYVFSIENFTRSSKEVKEIMKLAEEGFDRILKEARIHKYKVRVKAIGRINLLPKTVQEAIKKAEVVTKNYNKYLLNIAIGYSGRAEIVDAIKAIARDVKSGKINDKEIDEALIERYLYTSGVPDPDLIIRTSGEERLSGFLLWQSAYSELYFCDVFWPAIRKIDFWRALRTFQMRERRFGK